MKADGTPMLSSDESLKERDMTTTKVKAFYADFSNDLEVAKFPEDFADWLMEEGREQDAREFLLTIKDWQELTPRWDQTVDQMVEIAEDWAPVFDFSEEIRAPRTTYSEALALLRDMERVDEPGSEDTPLTWDREAEIVNRAIADEALFATANALLAEEEDEWSLQEFPEVEVYMDDDDDTVSIALKTFYALANGGYEEGAKTFLAEIRHLIHRPRDYFKMFWIIWTYVTVLPEPGSRISRSWRN